MPICVHPCYFYLSGCAEGGWGWECKGLGRMGVVSPSNHAMMGCEPVNVYENKVRKISCMLWVQKYPCHWFYLVTLVIFMLFACSL